MVVSVFRLVRSRPSCPCRRDRDAAKILPEPYLIATISIDNIGWVRFALSSFVCAHEFLVDRRCDKITADPEDRNRQDLLPRCDKYLDHDYFLDEP